MPTPEAKGFKDRNTGTVYALNDETARAAAAKAVQFEEQSLTSEQQAQARTNIGAVSESDVTTAISGNVDTGLNTTGKSADSKAAGDAIAAVQTNLDNYAPIDYHNNLYANQMTGVCTVSSGTKLQRYGTAAEPNTNYLTARIPVSASTKYSVLFSAATDFIQIVTAANKVETSDFSTTNPISLTSPNLIASKTDRSTTAFTFTTDANAAYLYICSTKTGETDAYIYVGAGEVTTLPYPTRWLDWLDAYKKSQSDGRYARRQPIIVDPAAAEVDVYFPISESIYGKLVIAHVTDEDDDKYVDYWRITGGSVGTYDGTNYVATATTLIGGENECAVNIQGMGDHIGGYHGNERIDKDDNCYVVFIVDGKEYSITDLVTLGKTACWTFAYREVSQMFATYSYDNDHIVIADHTKITEVANGGYKTTNYIKMDLSDTEVESITVLTAYMGLACIASAFAAKAVSDVGTVYTASHPSSTTALAENMNVYSRAAKTFNDWKSCLIDSKLLGTNIDGYEDAGVDVDIWDRQQDLKYYSFLPASVSVATGDWYATEAQVRFEVKA